MFIFFIFIYSCNSFIVQSNKFISRNLVSKMYTKSQSVGIDKTLSDYLSHIKHNRVDGFVKFLVEDFHVHEIDLNGKLLNLGEFLKLSEVKKAVENKKRTQSGQIFLCSYNDTSTLDYPLDLFTDMDIDRMNRLLSSMAKTLRTGTVDKEPHFTLLICKQGEDMKGVRTRVHKWIRTELPFLETKTIDFNTCQNNEKLRDLSGSYLDFSTLSHDYNLIHVIPNSICTKLLTSIKYKGPELLDDIEYTNNDTENTQKSVKIEEKDNNNRDNIKDNKEEKNEIHLHNMKMENNKDDIDNQEKEDKIRKENEKEKNLDESNNSQECISNTLNLDDMVKKIDMTDYDTYNAKSYGRFLHFNMLKINRETSEVVNMMCKSAKRASFDFFSAGNKDKRGITVQRLCIRRCTIPDLLEAMSKNWFKDVYLSDFCYKNYKIGLGDLSGNHFKIVIRGIEDPTKVLQSIHTLKSHGFINYFGLQRFGTKIVGTHMVGAALIDQKYELALRLILGDIDSAKEYNIFNKYYNNIDGMKLSLNTEYILNNNNTNNNNIINNGYHNTNSNRSNTSNGYNNTPYSFNSSLFQNYSNMYNNNISNNDINIDYYNSNINTNQNNISNNINTNIIINDKDTTTTNYINGSILEDEDVTYNKFKRAIDYYLFDNDPETALKYIPSHLFVEKSLLRGIISDLSFEKCLEKVPKNILSIYVHSTQSVLFNLAATERLNRYGHKVVVGDLVVTSEEDRNVDTEEDSDYSEESKTIRKKRMQVLEVNTEEEAERYTIEEVVLPLPGDNIIYPQNMKDYYNKISMDNFNIPLENFSTYRNINGNKIKGLVSVSGSYRFLIVKPRDVTFKIIDKLKDPFEVIIKPEIEDYEEDLEKRETPKNLEKIKNLGEYIKNKSAVVLTCSLPKSSYITVALREILTDESIENNHGK